MIALAFFLCFIAHVLQAVLGVSITLLAFAPFLGVCLMRSPLRSCLWLAAAAGCLVDLFSDDPMGLHALNYVAVSGILYRFRKRFSYDEPLHLGLYTAFISFVSMILQLILLFLFDRRVPLHGKCALVDLLCMQLADGVYGLVWIALPLCMVKRLRYKWMVYCLKNKNLSQNSR
ncbi:MAG: hypothetical protein IT584_00350 [Chlamydiae bacterium]|nr:hypothetical protein [Chlamydiota bacterium]